MSNHLWNNSSFLCYTVLYISLVFEKERDYSESVLNSNRQLYLVAIYNNEIFETALFSSFTKTRLSHGAEISIPAKKCRKIRRENENCMNKIIL